MKSSRWIFSLAALGLVAGLIVTSVAFSETSPAKAPAENAQSQPRYMLTGDQSGAWIVCVDQAKSAFGLVHKSLGGKWEWKAADLDGTPAVAQSVGDLVHLVFPQGDYVTYAVRPDGCESFPGPRISGKPLSACAAVPPSGGVPSLVLILSDMAATASGPGTATLPAKGATSNPHSMPTTGAAATPKTGVYQTTSQSLTLLAAMDGLKITPSARLMPAMVNGALFVMISDPPSPNRLLAWRDKQWQPIEIQGRLASAAMLTSLALPDGRLAMVLAEPASSDATSQPATQMSDLRMLTIARSSDQGKTFDFQTITLQGVPATWPAASLPQTCLMGRNILLLWQGQGSPQLATADLEGQIVSTEPMDILTGPPQTSYADVVANGFMWAVVIAIFFTLFMVRPVGPPKPFTLPETVRPGNLVKRLLAAMIDFMPFSMIALAVFQPPVLTWTEMMAAGKSRPPDAYFYASITAISLYVVYCIVMELCFSATVGKMIFRLRVVGDDARRPGLREVILRNLVKIIELLPVWPGLPIPFLLLAPLLTSKRQRIGDMLARTAVVNAATLPDGQPLPPADNGQDEPPVQE